MHSLRQKNRGMKNIIHYESPSASPFFVSNLNRSLRISCLIHTDSFLDEREKETSKTKDLNQKCQVETLNSVIPSQSNIVSKEDKSIENVRKSIEMLKKQEEEAREKAKQMQQMLEALQKDKREQIEKQFMSYINKISKEAFDEAVGKIKDDDLTLESVLLEIKSLDLHL